MLIAAYLGVSVNMLRPPAALISSALVAELARYYWVNGYVPYGAGRRIYAAVQPELFWAMIAIFVIGALAGLGGDLYALRKEQKAKRLGESHVNLAAERFLRGKFIIGHSVIWSSAISVLCISLWVLFALTGGSCDPKSWACGHWGSALVLAAFAFILDSCGIGTSHSGETLVFKRLRSVSGNLPLKGAVVREEGNTLILENLGARYKIRLWRLSDFNRRVVLRALAA